MRMIRVLAALAIGGGSCVLSSGWGQYGCCRSNKIGTHSGVHYLQGKPVPPSGG